MRSLWHPTASVTAVLGFFVFSCAWSKYSHIMKVDLQSNIIAGKVGEKKTISFSSVKLLFNPKPCLKS